ncbi:hypothetical protein T440DRAFT_206298, partial [Plenodomus tracheiphilus IPT5]
YQSLPRCRSSRTSRQRSPPAHWQVTLPYKSPRFSHLLSPSCHTLRTHLTATMAQNNNPKQDTDLGRAAKHRRQGDQFCSDPSKYDFLEAMSPITPLWNSSNGAIYTIPAMPPSDPDHEFADIFSGSLFLSNTPRIAPLSPIRPHASIVPVSSFANDAVQPPREPRAMRLSRGRASRLDSETATRREPDFVPYFEPEDVRNSKDLGRATTLNGVKETMRSILTSKDGNEKLWVDETKETSPDLPEEASKTDAKAKSKSGTAALKREPASPVRTAHVGIRPMTAVTEGPATLTFIEKSNSQPKGHVRTSSVTLAKVRQLRAEKLQKTPEDELPIKHVRFADPMDSTKTATSPLKSCLRKSEVATQSAGQSAALASDRTAGLSAAVEDTSVSPELPPSPSGSWSEDMSAAPMSLNLNKIKAAKHQQKIPSSDNIVADIQEAINTEIEKPANDAVHAKKASANSSLESVASVGSSEFESVAMPLWDEAEKNGGQKKKWYNFRK